jgi:histidinol-phosphate phosphatase family protein
MNYSERYRYIFLDRDGVINVERKNDYVKNPSELIFEADALKAIALLSQSAKYIFVVTNQRGVGRGIMTLDDLTEVHNTLLDNVKRKGGNIQKIYCCTDTNSSSINRKPHVGMAFQAQTDFPEVEFTRSIMVGNSKSDIEFGHKLGMFTVLVGDKYPKEDDIYKLADAHYANLYQFALGW